MSKKFSAASVITVLRKWSLPVLFLTTQISIAAPVKLIFDTDFRTDVDDPGTLAMLHGLQNEGRVEILGVISTTAGPGVVGAIDAVNTYFARPGIPIGLIAAARATGGGDPYSPTLADTNRYPSAQANATAPGATALYRRLLDRAETNSVVIVVVGGQNAAYDLMISPANASGDGIAHTGMALIQAKVTKLIVMGGNFADAAATENNILRGVAAAQRVAATWPTPIVYSGWEVGRGVRTGKALTNPAVNPVAKAYEMFGGSGAVGTIGDRDSWDQTAVLFAVVGLSYNGTQLWTLSSPCDITFDNSGRTIKSPAPNATRFYLQKTLDDNAIASIISTLMTAPPKLQ